MDSRRVATPAFRSWAGWLGPAAVGVALVVGAFIAASYIAGPAAKADPMQDTINKLEGQIRADPSKANLRVAVADAYMKQHRVPEALAQYHEALRINSNSEDALYGLGLAYREQGDLNQAGAALQAVINANKSNPTAALDQRLQGAHYYLGLILRDQGRYDDAINELRIALGLNRSDADTLFELGKTFALKGNNNDASSAFELALAFVPDFRDGYVELGKLAVTTHDQPKAEYAQAMIDVLDGKAKSAVPRLRAVAEQGQNAHYWWALGYALEKTNDKKGAIAAYQKSVAINPGEMLAAESLQQLQGGGAQ